MPIAEGFWGFLPPGPVSVAASECMPLCRTAKAVRSLGESAASAGMARTVQKCDPVFGWVFAIAVLRPLRNGTRLVVSQPNAVAVGAAAAVVVEPAGDADGDDAGGAGVVGGCDVEPRSPG